MLTSESDVRPLMFFARHAFFRFDEFYGACALPNRKSAWNTLAHYARAGVIMSVRRGLYWVRASTFDPLLVPGRLHRDAVLAFGAAAAHYGLCDLEHSCAYLAPVVVPRWSFGEMLFHCVHDRSVARPVERVLQRIEERPQGGHAVRVTPLERTLVDCCSRADLAPQIEQIMLRFIDRHDLAIDLKELTECARERANGTGCARLGLMLASHRRHQRQHGVLEWLERRVQAGSGYLCRDRKPGGVYFARWKLVVPADLAGHFCLE